MTQRTVGEGEGGGRLIKDTKLLLKKTRSEEEDGDLRKEKEEGEEKEVTEVEEG